MKRIVILIALQMISFQSSSSLYPMLSDVRVNQITPTFFEVLFTQSLVNIGPAGDVKIPLRGSRMSMGLGSVWGSNGNYTFYQQENAVLIKQGETYSEAALRAFYGGHSKVTRMTSSQFGDKKVGACVGYAATAPEFGNNWINATSFPQGLCVVMPKPGEWCKMTTPTLVLDHGRLSVKETEGHSASDKLNINCTSGSVMTLRLMNKEKYIRLSDTARSNIFVDGNSIGGEVRLKAGDNLLTISDKLTGITEPGEFNGMAILVVEPA